VPLISCRAYSFRDSSLERHPPKQRKHVFRGTQAEILRDAESVGVAILTSSEEGQDTLLLFTVHRVIAAECRGADGFVEISHLSKLALSANRLRCALKNTGVLEVCIGDTQ